MEQTLQITDVVGAVLIIAIAAALKYYTGSFPPRQKWW